MALPPSGMDRRQRAQLPLLRGKRAQPNPLKIFPEFACCQRLGLRCPRLVATWKTGFTIPETVESFLNSNLSLAASDDEILRSVLMLLFGLVYLLAWSVWACCLLRSFPLVEKTEVDVVIKDVPSSSHTATIKLVLMEATASLRALPRSSWWPSSRMRIEDTKKQRKGNDVGDLASSIWSAGSEVVVPSSNY